MTGLRAATIADVAAAAGVSPAAVSKVIRNAYGVSPAMRERVTAAIELLNYRPNAAARSMRGRSFTFGFAIPQLGNEFFTELINGALDCLTGTGYQLIIAPESSEVRSTQMLDALTDRQVDGIIAVSPVATPEWLEQLARRVHLTLIGRHDSSQGYDTVTGDDRQGANLVMDHLFDQGHQRIAHLTGDWVVPSASATDPHAIRMQTYMERMREAGLSPFVARSGPGEDQAADATTQLLGSSDRPTAIFAGNDTLAIGALRATADAGARISIVGYDGIPLAGHPLVALSTIDQSGPDMGRAAAKLLLERASGRIEPVHYQVEPVLRVRGSSLIASECESFPA